MISSNADCDVASLCWQPMVTHYSNGGWACLMIIGLNSFASQLFLNRGSQLLSAAKAGTIGTLQASGWATKAVMAGLHPGRAVWASVEGMC